MIPNKKKRLIILIIEAVNQEVSQRSTIKIKIKLPKVTDMASNYKSEDFHFHYDHQHHQNKVYYPSYFFEFVFNIMLQPHADDYERLLNQFLMLDETNLKKDQSFSKRTILLYDKLRDDAQFNFSHFFTPKGQMIIERNYHLGSAQWTCKICSLDSNYESIGCDYCNEWFHFFCVSIKRIPKNEWFCQECKLRCKATKRKQSLNKNTHLKKQAIAHF